MPLPAQGQGGNEEQEAPEADTRQSVPRSSMLCDDKASACDDMQCVRIAVHPFIVAVRLAEGEDEDEA